ncbi:MAG TPA: hypothetical protein DIU09_08915 [Hyphomonadaceae bacterium]|nr:hypothetical protein AEM38_00840 [Hyphomonadaceae bacterium UKL13-1]HCP64696.1 hypothetical protein [Hyphomonadaceae bacterium]
MRALTMDELSVVSGGIKNPWNNPTRPTNPAAETGRGTREDIHGTVVAGNGLAVGFSRNEDGSINLGGGVGMGIVVSNDSSKEQGLALEFAFDPSKLPRSFSMDELKKFVQELKDGKAAGGAVMLWLGAATDAERQQFWEGAFKR